MWAFFCCDIGKPLIPHCRQIFSHLLTTVKMIALYHAYFGIREITVEEYYGHTLASPGTSDILSKNCGGDNYTINLILIQILQEIVDIICRR